MPDFPLVSQNLRIRPFTPEDEDKLYAFLSQTMAARSADEYDSAVDCYIQQCRDEATVGAKRRHLTLGVFDVRQDRLMGRFLAKATDTRPDEWALDSIRLKERDKHMVELLRTVLPYFEKRLKAQFVVAQTKRQFWKMRDALEMAGFKPVDIDEIGYAHYQKTLKPVTLSII